MRVARAAQSGAMERAIDDVRLLLAREPHKINRIARYADREIRILLRTIHRIDERFPVQHIHVHVKTSDAEECVEHAAEIRYSIIGDSAQSFRNQRSR